jgi:hypothetical protein
MSSISSLQSKVVVRKALEILLMTAVAGAAFAQEKVGPPDLNGVWKPTHVSLEDPRWRIEDLACAGMCSLTQFDYLQSLLRDSRNDSRQVKDLYYESFDHHLQHNNGLLNQAGRDRVAGYQLGEGAALDCSPDGDGWSTQLFAPLPSRIEQFDDRVVIRYEYWNAVRTIYLDGREPPEDLAPSRLGYSTGHYEGGILVAETTNLLPGELYLPGGATLVALKLSSIARGTEHYSLSEDGERLDLVWSVSDPEYLHAPLQGQKSVLRAPGWELEEFTCESITGEY